MKPKKSCVHGFPLDMRFFGLGLWLFSKDKTSNSRANAELGTRRDCSAANRCAVFDMTEVGEPAPVLTVGLASSLLCLHAVLGSQEHGADEGRLDGT